MAGHALRYDQEWYYRATNGAWSLVNVDLSPDSTPRARDTTRVTDPTLRDVIEQLFDDVQTERLPERLRPGLVVPVPPPRELLDDAVQRRPKRTT